jgi:hypothetical protein
MSSNSIFTGLAKKPRPAPEADSAVIKYFDNYQNKYLRSEQQSKSGLKGAKSGY